MCVRGSVQGSSSTITEEIHLAASEGSNGIETVEERLLFTNAMGRGSTVEK